MTPPSIADVEARIIKVSSAYQYADAQIQMLIKTLTADTTGRERRATQTKMSHVLLELGAKRGREVSGLIRLAYARGMHFVNPVDRFTVGDVGAIETMIDSLSGHIYAAERTVARTFNDAVQKANLLSYSQSNRDLEQVLTAIAHQGLSGKRWGLADYVNLVVRTSGREALSEGTLSGMKRHGLDIVKVSSGGSVLSGTCKPWDGGTFSISGDSTEYPKLDAVPPFHPNCEHYIYPDGI